MIPYFIELDYFYGIGVQHPCNGAKLIQQLMGGLIGVAARVAIEEKQLQKLVVLDNTGLGQKGLLEPLSMSVVEALFSSPRHCLGPGAVLGQIGLHLRPACVVQPDFSVNFPVMEEGNQILYRDDGAEP